jgi:hypothetical protein
LIFAAKRRSNRHANCCFVVWTAVMLAASTRRAADGRGVGAALLEILEGFCGLFDRRHEHGMGTSRTFDVEMQVRRLSLKLKARSN